MKLGRALATGVAEERPQDRDEQLELAQEIGEIGEIEVAEASAPEEVPVAR
ncbi:hypothetical protein ACWCQZ_09270 [Streptomyces sp. NPDC002285]|uniref:hypothetical protein n=1 Tax=unclassified Streptomyces TaxID=2593676 RepID=UPI00367ED5E8